jgi:hypothetical protein
MGFTYSNKSFIICIWNISKEKVTNYFSVHLATLFIISQIDVEMVAGYSQSCSGNDSRCYGNHTLR